MTVSGLANGVTYEFAVAALNAAGLGSWSGMTSTGTPNGVGPVPPQAPYNLSATAGNGQVTVSFTPPGASGGSPVTDYLIIYQPQGGSWAWYSDGTSTLSQITVPGLSNGTSYQFMVAAQNAAGLSPWSWPTTGTPSGP